MNQTQKQKRDLRKRTARKYLLKNSGGKGKKLMGQSDMEARAELNETRLRERKKQLEVIKK